jgi:putative N6-adenine-specific DNA methylase
MRFFVTAAKGTEGVLRDELRELGFRQIRADRGGVHVDGSSSVGWRLCLESRIGIRVLERLTEAEVRDADDLYELGRDLRWEQWMTVQNTLAVGASARDAFTSHTQFLSQRLKDAVVDHFRDRVGKRPSVNLEDPDLRLFLHMQGDHATVYRDLSGEPLYKRGYRTNISDAPLKEHLAAAMLRLSGWTRGTPLVDPMCGSGTIALEADLWARDISPGIARYFGFERHVDFDRSAKNSWAAMREESLAMQRSEGPPIFASDVDHRVLLAARENARNAHATVLWSELDVKDLAPRAFEGAVVCNPPFGERIEGAETLYRTMSEAFARMNGHSITVITGTTLIEDALAGERALRETHRPHQVFNGSIDCRILRYRVGNKPSAADPTAVDRDGNNPRENPAPKRKRAWQRD